MVKKLKNLLEGLLSLDKNLSGLTQASSSGDNISEKKLEDDLDLCVTPFGSISEGALAQNLPVSRFHPGYRRETKGSEQTKSRFIIRFSDLVSTKQYTEALESLKEQTLKMDSSLFNAASDNNASLCKALMDRREYGEIIARCNAKNSDGQTPLHIASKLGFITVCEVLLDYGENIEINAQDNLGQTPLLCACVNNHLNIAQLLVRSGAKVNLTDIYECSCLHYVIQNGNKEFLE